MKIVILDGYTLNPGDLSWNSLKQLGELTVYERTPAEKINERLQGAQAVFTNKTPITRQSIQSCPTLCFIGVLATGYNVVDTQAAKEQGIPVCNIPTYGTAAVAQFTIALLLELCHHIGEHSDSVHRGEWANSPDWCYWHTPLMELSGKTLGVIGFGRIGQATAAIASALGMEILAFDAHPTQSGKALGTYVELAELFARADVVTLHCPLFPQTQGIICKQSISQMKNGALLLNASRGPLVVEQDLCDALNSGKLGGAALDVVSTEPILASNPLLNAKNCLLTPHIAWAPVESRQRLMDIAVDNLRQFLDGHTVHNVWA